MYFEKLQSFVQTINSLVNRETKLAPNTVTRNYLPALLSTIANSSTKMVQKPKFHVCDYVPIAKNVLPFRKGYKQISKDQYFEITAIPTVNRATYSIIDAEEEEINGKFYEKELKLIGTKQILMKMGNDELTVRFISTASMDFFPDNTFGNSFRPRLES